ncbi:hypothetical protein LTR37_004303 [Vermiconidia calcicola]|uniref:Uncharacterized protein n=1 Tax=Vermiconidia calcicola TaxID=1690605 RepID=A0ACC3NMI1_9PEZI|nr:hypothetical protein LTR37_004303 [Vermiconidia calcicola]
MVATRRMVQKDPMEGDLASNPTLTLKKKPIRKATAKNNTKPETNTRATRGRQAMPEPENFGEGAAEQEEQAAPAKATRRPVGRPKKEAVKSAPIAEEMAEPAKPTRSTKAGLVRSKRTVSTLEDTSVAEVPEEPKGARSTRAGSVRGRKAAAPTEEEPTPTAADEPMRIKGTKSGSVRGRKAAAVTGHAPALPAPKPKPTCQTRNTATTTHPLSPKKITQVSKPAPRATRNASEKSASKNAVPKPSTRGKVATRKRTVSDENADVQGLHATTDGEEDVVMLSSTPVNSKSTRQAVKGQDEDAQSEASLSSRPTTPTDSTMQSFSHNADEEDEEMADADSVSGDDIAADPEQDVSEDELCGPKTPMKRSSVGAEARYHSSAQRTIRKYDDELRLGTPARRFADLRSQRGTPQTQRPYSKPAPPTSEARPMTVARGAHKAFVFKDLRDGVPNQVQATPSISEEDDLSFYPDEDIIPVDDEAAMWTPTAAVQPSEQLQSARTSVSEADDSDIAEDSTMSKDIDGEGFVDPADVEQDPDETVLVYDGNEGSASPMVQPDESFETEDTIILSRPERFDDGGSMMGYTSEMEPEEDPVVLNESRTPAATETIDWQQAREEATITVNFEDLFSGARSTMRPNLVDDDTTIGAAITPTPNNEEDAVAGAEMDLDMDFEVSQQPPQRQTLNEEDAMAGAELVEHFDFGVAEQSPGRQFADFSEGDAIAGAAMDAELNFDVSQPSSRRQTMNLTEFIDVAALAEPTEKIFVDTAGPSQRQEEPALIEDAPEEANSTISSPVAETPEDQQRTKDAQDEDMSDAVEAQSEPAEEPKEKVDSYQEEETPHYALPTIAYDARRKSLPSFAPGTPGKVATRPNTSDGASISRMGNPFANAWWARSRTNSTATTPVKARPSIAHATPVANYTKSPSKSPAAKPPTATPRERFPRLPPQQDYEGHANTVAAPKRFGNPSEKPTKRRETFHRAVSGRVAARKLDTTPSTPATQSLEAPQRTPAERYSNLRLRQDNQEHAKTVAAPKRFQMPSDKPMKRRDTFHKGSSGQAATTRSEPAPSTHVEPEVVQTAQATPGERYPRLKPRQDYQEHAKTVAPPVRFCTPVKKSLKRPATAQKPDSLRKAAMIASTPRGSHTSIKSPLKDAAMTPGQAPMTPHAAAPLRGVVALVEVFTLEGASASQPFVALLNRLGAKTTKSWSDRVTHVIFKDGSPTTLQRVRVNNKEVEEKGTGAYIHCVNSRWINDCETEGTRMDECDEAYAVDVAEVPRGGKRRRKSMEPSALLNIGGNIVRGRKSSVGRHSSLGRSPLKFDSPAKKAETPVDITPKADVVMDKENSESGFSSPATPAWIAAPDQLLQQTAPMNRVRKLELQGKHETKNRRLTFWQSGA